jgi:hypothetical protein
VTATGTILSVAPQVYEDCEVWGGTLRTASGENVTFAAGGVMPLGAQEAATVKTLEDGARQGSRASVTIDYVASRTLCDIALAHFVTSASLKLLPPPPIERPPPPSTPPEPTPTAGSASGIVTLMSPVAALVSQPHADGTRSFCNVWRGALRTDAGRAMDIYVQSPLTGNLDAGGLLPTDPTAFGRVTALQHAAALRYRAPVRISYLGPVKACGLPLTGVVTAVTVKVRKTHKQRGRITRISRPVVVAGAGTRCKIWKGSLKTRSGRAFRFAIETDLGSPFYPHRPDMAADPAAARIVKFLKHDRALGRGVVTTVTYMGPIEACGRKLKNVVTNARQRFVR